MYPSWGLGLLTIVGRNQTAGRIDWTSMAPGGKKPSTNKPSRKAWYWPITWMHPLQPKSGRLQDLKIPHHRRCPKYIRNNGRNYMNLDDQPFSEPWLIICLPSESSRNGRGGGSEHSLVPLLLVGWGLGNEAWTRPLDMCTTLLLEKAHRVRKSILCPPWLWSPSCRIALSMFGSRSECDKPW